MMTVRFLKDWKGSVSVRAAGTVADLVAALCCEAALADGDDVVLMIVRGRRFNPAALADSSLASIGVADGGSVMLLLRSPEQRAAVAVADERMSRLHEVETAAAAMAERVGLGPVDGRGFDLTITNQAGAVIELPESGRRAFALGALLHAKGRALLDRAAAVLDSARGPRAPRCHPGGAGDCPEARRRPRGR